MLTMQNNYHFLSQLTPALDKQLRNSVVSECYSQDKAELIVRFETNDGSFHLRANLSPAFTCLSCPKDFQRARKNSVDLFQRIVGHRVAAIRQHSFDRSFTIAFQDNLALVIKLHGNRSNIILFENDSAIDLFRKNIDADLHLNPADLNRTMDLSFEAFAKHQESLSSLYFTFGKIPWMYLQTKGFATLDLSARWEALQEVFKLLNTPKYYLARIDGELVFTLLPLGEIERTFDNPIAAITTFSQVYRSREGFEDEQSRVTTLLRKRFTQTGDALERAKERLQSLLTHDKWKLWADLIMAHLHVSPENDRIIVTNFYNDNKPEEIRIQPTLSLQKNAAHYYAKSKKQQIEIKYLEELISQRQRELTTLQSELETLGQIDDIKILRSFAAKHPPPQASDHTESLPYHEQLFMGYRILIGRNAQANDELLQRFSFKDDLWLHAKDVTGSHVLIKYQAGKTIPRTVIERAGQLAAWYSKRKTDTLCPVSVTPRKYVRKRKGDPAGAVVVERESVLLVSPTQ